ncbi:hypothetical protein Glove_19g329 [Diversispora epigaea]|uniref:Uncharacterized protein n=1 Tax=Diversispora epigaea TaxID=1348612 RepID=A0A397JXE1_9GLOM|nr:hypothetical protein Glove_19g329 [Diversispora epigaea]
MINSSVPLTLAAIVLAFHGEIIANVDYKSNLGGRTMDFIGQSDSIRVVLNHSITVY